MATTAAELVRADNWWASKLPPLIGLALAQALLDELGEPLLSSTLILPGEDTPLMDPYDMRQTLGHAVDLVIDGGACGIEPTSVIDLVGPFPEVIRKGMGNLDHLLGP